MTQALKTQLKRKARASASASAGTREAQEPLKEGEPCEHSRKHEAPVIGMSLGSTINMGQYESLRVDAWATVPREPGDLQPQFEALREILGEVLEETVSEYKGE
jgi:hypothetical protein